MALSTAASLAGASRHPLAHALARARSGEPVAEGVEEVPGFGLRQSTPQGEVQLGNRVFCGCGRRRAAGTGAVAGPAGA